VSTISQVINKFHNCYGILTFHISDSHSYTFFKIYFTLFFHLFLGLPSRLYLRVFRLKCSFLFTFFILLNNRSISDCKVRSNILLSSAAFILIFRWIIPRASLNTGTQVFHYFTPNFNIMFLSAPRSHVFCVEEAKHIFQKVRRRRNGVNNPNALRL
jgi:hypothetical protein